MNDPENFLSRWSRRKRTAAEEGEPTESTPPEAVAKDQAPAETARFSETKGEEKKEEGAEPVFDLSKLPSLESITAETDVRAFLAPGVPAELTRAALRRVWVVDPKIRDFIEIAENQWDFTAPGVPGFDLSPPTGDIKQMLAQILPKSGADESGAEQDAKEADATTSSIEGPSHRNVTEVPMETLESPDPEREKFAPAGSAANVGNGETENAAPQKVSALQEEQPTPKRGHGGAMPR
jgi:Protein of unknown function (DUF3306)